jgi:V8-like Glu-specific endopeptidase
MHQQRRRPRDRARTAAWIALSLLCACSADVDPAARVGLRGESVVYGDDDRRDLHQASEPLASLARRTAVALIAPALLRPSGDHYVIEAPAYGELQRLCPGERFADQPAAASCSGVLVARDVVATASHCLATGPDGSAACSEDRYVLGYGITEPGVPIAIAASDVFECKRVLGRARTPRESLCRYDIVLVELDRGAVASIPAVLRSLPAEAGEALAVIGFPAGLPVKIDEGASVVDARSTQGDFFTLSDTFGVSSGSGVFDAQGELVGLFARGRQDYEDGPNCQRVRREAEVGASGYEEATHVAAIRALQDALQWGAGPERKARAQVCDPAAYLKLDPALGGEPGPATANACASAARLSRSTPVLYIAWGLVAAAGLVRTRQRRGKLLTARLTGLRQHEERDTHATARDAGR